MKVNFVSNFRHNSLKCLKIAQNYCCFETFLLWNNPIIGVTLTLLTLLNLSLKHTDIAPLKSRTFFPIFIIYKKVLFLGLKFPTKVVDTFDRRPNLTKACQATNQSRGILGCFVELENFPDLWRDDGLLSHRNINITLAYHITHKYLSQYYNKPSFCSGSCDKIHATKLHKKLHLKIFDTSLKLFMKFSSNTLDAFLHP